jgi:hypothetical protein
MGVKTTLAGLTISAAGKNQAELMGADITGMISELQLHCTEMITQLTYLVNDILTPGAGDAGNITTINTQITNLS